MPSALLRLVTLWNVPGKVFPGVGTDVAKWRRLKRSPQAPLINLSIMIISPCVFLMGRRLRGRTPLERQAPRLCKAQVSRFPEKSPQASQSPRAVGGRGGGADSGPTSYARQSPTRIPPALQRLPRCSYSRKPSWNAPLLFL